MKTLRESISWQFVAAVLLVIAVLTSCLPQPAHANEVSVSYGINTAHLDSGSYNESNSLIAVQYENLVAASFNNSYGKDTVALGYSFAIGELWDVELDVIGGVMNGYTKSQMFTCVADESCLFVAPRLTYKFAIIQGVDLDVSSLLLGTAFVTTVGVTVRF